MEGRVRRNESLEEEEQKPAYLEGSKLTSINESELMSQEIHFEKVRRQTVGIRPIEAVGVEEYKMPRFLIRHNDPFRLRWDLFIILLVVWNCISIPFNVAFSANVSWDDSTLITIVERAIDICFFADIIINFRTTFVNSKTRTEIIDSKGIAINYVVYGRFFVDLAASIPFELLYSSFSSSDSARKQNNF